MTNTEAITKLTNIMHDDHYSWHPSVLEVFRMAVDALRGAEGDCISRRDAIEDAREAFKRNPTMAIRVMDLIKSMPSIQPSFPQRHENDHFAEVSKMDCISRQTAIAEFSCCELTPDGGIDANYAINFLEQMPPAQTEQCKDAVSKAKVLETYADLYDVFDDNKEIQNELHKVFDRINNLPPAQPEHNSDDERKIADLHKMVNYLLSRLESQWIPVSEGLPKEYGEYICTMENGQVQECGFVPENQRGLVDGWSTCEADGHKFLGYADVLAWMPLPEPWKEGESDEANN